MSRILIAIAIIFMSSALIAHGVLAYQFNAVQTLLAEEEPHDDKPSDKGKSDKDKHFFDSFFNSRSGSDLHLVFLSSHNNILPKGFIDKPYLPPDVI